MIGIPGGLPTRHTALRMGHRNGIFSCTCIDLVDGCCDGLGHHGVVDAGRRQHCPCRYPASSAEELVKCFFSGRKLGAFVVGKFVIQVSTNAELGVPGPVGGFGVDGTGYGGLPGFAPAGLVDQEYTMSHFQEHIGPAFRPSGVVIQPIRD